LVRESAFDRASSSDHILTIEDPIEFLHSNKKSIVNQREVGLRYRFGSYSSADDAGDSVDSSRGFEGYSRGTAARRRLIPVKPARETLGQV